MSDPHVRGIGLGINGPILGDGNYSEAGTGDILHGELPEISLTDHVIKAPALIDGHDMKPEGNTLVNTLVATDKIV